MQKSLDWDVVKGEGFFFGLALPFLNSPVLKYIQIQTEGLCNHLKSGTVSLSNLPHKTGWRLVICPVEALMHYAEKTMVRVFSTGCHITGHTLHAKLIYRSFPSFCFTTTACLCIVNYYADMFNKKQYYVDHSVMLIGQSFCLQFSCSLRKDSCQILPEGDGGALIENAESSATWSVLFKLQAISSQ